MQIHRKKKTPERGCGVGGDEGHSSLSISAGYELSRHNDSRLCSLHFNLSLSRAHYIYIYIDRYIPKTLSLSSFQIRSAIFFFYFSTYKEGPFLSNKISKKEKKKRKKKKQHYQNKHFPM